MMDATKVNVIFMLPPPSFFPPFFSSALCTPLKSAVYTFFKKTTCVMIKIVRLISDFEIRRNFFPTEMSKGHLQFLDADNSRFRDERVFLYGKCI